jgi:hypothetical protein
MSAKPDLRQFVLASLPTPESPRYVAPAAATSTPPAAVMHADFIDPGDPRWRRTLARARHDVYHLPEYVITAAKQEGGTPAAFYAESGETAFLVPLVIRELPAAFGAPADWRDAVTPYGYPCPIVAGRSGPGSIAGFLAAFRDVGRAAGLVSAFFRLHPLLELPAEAFIPFGQLDQSGVTVYIDLRRSSAELWSQTRRDHRAGVRKLQSAGYAATLGEWSHYREFGRLYRHTMERVDASDFYFFSDEYFENLPSALDGRLHFCSVLSPQGDLAAGGLFCVTDGIVQYHLSATAKGHLHVAPSKLMLDHVRRWAKERGSTVLHLGGGLGGREDSLFRFKAGFSPLRAEFRTFRMVLDEHRYEALVNRWETLFPGVDATSDYFPSYRRELASDTEQPVTVGGDDGR